MANKFIIPGPPVVGAAASSVASCDLVVGPRYHVLWLRIKTAATTIPVLSTTLGLIRLKINGRTQRQMTALQLNAYNLLWGQQYGAHVTTAADLNTTVGWIESGGLCKTIKSGATADVPNGGLAGTVYSASSAAHVIHLPIFFAEPWRQQYAAQDMMALPTAWNGPGAVATLQLELTLGSTAAASGAVVIDSEVDYLPGLSLKDGSPLLLLSKFSQYGMTGFTSADTDNYMTTLPRRDVYQSIHAFADHASDVVSAVKVKLENNLIRDCNKGRLDQINVSRGCNPLAIHATRTDIVFDYDDQPDSGLPMVYNGRQVQDFQLILQKSAVNVATASLLAVTFGPLD